MSKRRRSPGYDIRAAQGKSGRAGWQRTDRLIGHELLTLEGLSVDSTMPSEKSAARPGYTHELRSHVWWRAEMRGEASTWPFVLRRYLSLVYEPGLTNPRKRTTGSVEKNF